MSSSSLNEIFPKLRIGQAAYEDAEEPEQVRAFFETGKKRILIHPSFSLLFSSNSFSLSSISITVNEVVSCVV